MATASSSSLSVAVEERVHFVRLEGVRGRDVVVPRRVSDARRVRGVRRRRRRRPAAGARFNRMYIDVAGAPLARKRRKQRVPAYSPPRNILNRCDPSLGGGEGKSSGPGVGIGRCVVNLGRDGGGGGLGLRPDGLCGCGGGGGRCGRLPPLDGSLGDSKSTVGPLLSGEPSSPKSLNSASLSSLKTPESERKSFLGL